MIASISRGSAGLAFFVAASLAAQSAQYTMVSAGCPGSSGLVPGINAAGVPVLGAPFRLTALNLPPNITDTVYMLTSFVRQSIPLDPIGMPGCILAGEQLIAQQILKNGTQATWSLNVPIGVGTAGVRFRNQVLAFDRPFDRAQWPNTFGAVLSDAWKGTVGAAPVDRVLVESFDDHVQFDESVSSALWPGGGRLLRGQVGGAGIHGEFDIRRLPLDADGARVWDTDAVITIPARNTLLGRQELTILDARPEFTRFVVPAGEVLRFVGSKLPMIRASGEIRIEGTVCVDGLDGPVLNGLDRLLGEPGGLGGPSGGAGGRGADAWLPSVPSAPPPLATPTAANAGAQGEDLRAPAGSGYAMTVAGTGGRGAPTFPASGLHTDVNTSVNSFYSSQQISGGGGGGYVAAGAAGSVPVQLDPSTSLDIGPIAAGGALLPPLFPPNFDDPIDHWLLGGSGGGGGGSVSTLVRPQILAPLFMRWINGLGGGGGGGAIALVSGGGLVTATSGRISARGGSSADSLDNTWTLRGSSVGGGGSGGSIVLQSMRQPQLQGTIDVRGGRGGTYTATSVVGNAAESRGGDGSPGFVRLERFGGAPSVGVLGTVLGPTSLNFFNVGHVESEDSASVARSRWYVLPSTSAPVFTDYEADAFAGGSQTYSSANPANVPGAPIRILLQGAEIDPVSGALIRPAGPWVDFATDLNGSGYNAVRFLVIFEHAFGTASVTEFRVLYTG